MVGTGTRLSQVNTKLQGRPQRELQVARADEASYDVSSSDEDESCCWKFGGRGSESSCSSSGDEGTSDSDCQAALVRDQPAEELYSITTFARGQGVGLAPISLPQTITGATITAILTIELSNGKRMRRVVIPVIFGFVATSVLKCWMALGCLSSLSDMANTCTGGYVYVRMACIVLFLLVVFKGLGSCFEMHRWVSRIPESMAYESLKMGKFERDRGGGKLFTWHAPVSGMTQRERLVIYMCILLPKAVLLVALCIFGSAYVVLADSNENLLLNSLAMAFLMDIDEQAFKFAMTPSVQSLITSFPPIGLGPDKLHERRTDYIMEAHSAWLGISALLVAASLLLFTWCGST